MGLIAFFVLRHAKLLYSIHLKMIGENESGMRKLGERYHGMKIG